MKVATKTAPSRLAALLGEGRAERFGLSGKTQVVQDATAEDMNVETFVFFTTYPDCGVTCHPIFMKLASLYSLQTTLAAKKFQIVNCPFEVLPAFLYHDYYKAEGVTWTWVKMSKRSEVRTALKNWGISAFVGCPLLSVAHAAGATVEQKVSSFGSKLSDHDSVFQCIADLL
jgi:hypothetical protein